MNDFERMTLAFDAACTEFILLVRNAVKGQRTTKPRISVQVSAGRILVIQVQNSTDFKPQSFGDLDELPESEVNDLVARTAGPVSDWREEVKAAIEKRRNGWLRFMLSISDGSVTGGNSNPSFDIKF